MSAEGDRVELTRWVTGPLDWVVEATFKGLGSVYDPVEQRQVLRRLVEERAGRPMLRARWLREPRRVGRRKVPARTREATFTVLLGRDELVETEGPTLAGPERAQ